MWVKEHLEREMIDVGNCSVKWGLMVLLVAFLTLNGHPQGFPGHDAATAGASVGSSGFSRIWGSPATWSERRKLSFGQFIHQPFLLKELTVKGLGVVLPVGKGAFGASWVSEGFRLFRKQDAGLGYSRRFGKKIGVGLKFHYLSLSLADDYGRANDAGFSLGFITSLSSALEGGTTLFYPVGKNTSLENSFQPYLLSGLCWKVSDELVITSEITKEASSPVRIRGSLFYSNKNHWSLQSGIKLYPLSCFAGIGFRNRQFTFCLNTGYQSLLGFSPTAIILYERN